MFGKKPKEETKQFSISQEEISEIAKLAQGQWIMQKLFKFAVAGFNAEIENMQRNIVAKRSVDESKFTVDWSTLFKDSKIFLHPKPQVEEKPNAEPKLSKRSKPGKKD